MPAVPRSTPALPGPAPWVPAPPRLPAAAQVDAKLRGARPCPCRPSGHRQWHGEGARCHPPLPAAPVSAAQASPEPWCGCSVHLFRPLLKPHQISLPYRSSASSFRSANTHSLKTRFLVCFGLDFTDPPCPCSREQTSSSSHPDHRRPRFHC